MSKIIAKLSYLCNYMIDITLNVINNNKKCRMAYNIAERTKEYSLDEFVFKQNMWV